MQIGVAEAEFFDLEVNKHASMQMKWMNQFFCACGEQNTEACSCVYVSVDCGQDLPLVLCCLFLARKQESTSDGSIAERFLEGAYKRFGSLPKRHRMTSLSIQLRSAQLNRCLALSPKTFSLFLDCFARPAN